MFSSEVTDDTLFKLEYLDTVPSLAKAAAAGDLMKVRTLLRKGYSPHAPDNRGWCSVHSAVASKQLEALKLILNFKRKNRKFLTNIRTWEGESPLVVAVMSDIVPLQIVKFLLESGADPTTATNMEMTALHYACKKKGNVDVVEILVNHGAVVNIKDAWGYTPLHYAIVESADENIVEFLVSHADVNLSDTESETPLFKACVCNFLKAAQIIMLKDRTSVNVMPKSQLSPLSAAAIHGNLQLVKLLLEAGANPVAKGPAAFHRQSLMEENFLPIHSSVHNVSVFRVLLEVTNPFHLLSYESTSTSVSLSVFTLMYSPKLECFEALLQFSFPPGFDQLKTVNFRKLTDFVLHTSDCRVDEIMYKFRLCFKYYSHFESDKVFEHFACLLSESKSELCKLLEKHDFLYVLAQIGVSSGYLFRSKLEVIQLLHSMLPTSEKKDVILESISNLSKPVLTLKQLSRVRARRYIRSVTQSDWHAYKMIRDSNYPSAIKEYLWYQIL